MRPRVLTMDYINVPMALLQEVKEAVEPRRPQCSHEVP